MLLGPWLLSGCLEPPPRIAASNKPERTQVAIITPRCADARSCFLGRITATETGFGLSGAVVFIQRVEGSERIVRMTDEQGVFVVVDPPPGQYRVNVYKANRRGKVAAMELGGPGTTVLTLALAAEDG